jgi:hypothetical protein
MAAPGYTRRRRVWQTTTAQPSASVMWSLTTDMGCGAVLLRRGL